MLFFQEGFLHITDLEGYDHMLFLFVLAAGYLFKDLKKLFWLATAFTIGHSVTLALSAMEWVVFSSKWVELLIPVTILLTALAKWWLAERLEERWFVPYTLVAFFGLIHGLGFSSYFKMLFNQSTDRVLALFQFNLGVEVGQLLLLLLFLSVNLLVNKVFQFSRKRVEVISLLFASLLSAYLILEKCMEW
jgi:hypothetical protein